MNIKICKTAFSQIRGLMFSRKKNLLFVYSKPTVVNLHMLFVFFPADALYLDEHMMVIDMVHMKPFRCGYKAKYSAVYILEVVEEHSFKVGDRLVINESEISKKMQG